MSEHLVREYRESGDLSLRSRLVLTYVPLVKHIVYKKIRELPASTSSAAATGRHAPCAPRARPGEGARDLHRSARTPANTPRAREHDARRAPREGVRVRRSDLTSLSSLAVTGSDGRIELIETIQTDDPEADPEGQATREEARAKFRRAFERLSPREREVAVLLYVKNLTLREIGEVLEVSESRVSQIHSQLKRRIRERLTNDSALFGETAG